MAPRGYTMNKRTGKFQPPKGTTMAARNLSTASKRGTAKKTGTAKKRKGR